MSKVNRTFQSGDWKCLNSRLVVGIVWNCSLFECVPFAHRWCHLCYIYKVFYTIMNWLSNRSLLSESLVFFQSLYLSTRTLICLFYRVNVGLFLLGYKSRDDTDLPLLSMTSIRQLLLLYLLFSILRKSFERSGPVSRKDTSESNFVYLFHEILQIISIFSSGESNRTFFGVKSIPILDNV